MSFSHIIILSFNPPSQPSAKPFKTKRIITMESIKNTYKSFVFHLHRKSINHFGIRASPLHLAWLPASAEFSCAWPRKLLSSKCVRYGGTWKWAADIRTHHTSDIGSTHRGCWETISWYHFSGCDARVQLRQFVCFVSCAGLGPYRRWAGMPSCEVTSSGDTFAMLRALPLPTPADRRWAPLVCTAVGSNFSEK